MAGIALSGLASGLDTNSMITQLLSAESVPRTRMTLQQAKTEQRVSLLQGLQTKLTALKTATTALQSVANWTPVQTAESSDATALAATWKGGAAAGTYSVQTFSLASSAQKTFDFVAPAADQTLTFGTTSVDITAGASLDDTVGAINRAGGGVVAVNAGGKLVVSASTTGAASNFTASGASITETGARAGTDATFSVDGGPTVSSATNAIANGVAGVDLTLKKVGVAGLTVSVPTADADAMIGKLKGFVDAYNAVVEATRTALTDKPVTGASTASDAKKGVLFGDQSLVRMLSSLRSGVGSPVSGLSGALSKLSELGVSTGASSGASSSTDALAGKLTFDEKPARALLASDPSAVRELLGAKTGVSGFAQAFGAQLAPYSTTGTGLADRIDQGNTEISRVRASLAKFDERMTKREATLRKQFAAMETALAAAQERQTNFASQLAQLTAQQTSN